MVRRFDFRQAWRLALAVAIWAVALPAFAQGMLQGVVVDEKGQPVEGAKIIIEQTEGVNRKFETKSDKKGSSGRRQASAGRGRGAAPAAARGARGTRGTRAAAGKSDPKFQSQTLLLVTVLAPHWLGEKAEKFSVPPGGITQSSARASSNDPARTWKSSIEEQA